MAHLIKYLLMHINSMLVLKLLKNFSMMQPLI
nr:MAG TPA: hypothetical protein [Caudoviricetes sp.]